MATLSLPSYAAFRLYRCGQWVIARDATVQLQGPRLSVALEITLGTSRIQSLPPKSQPSAGFLGVPLLSKKVAKAF